MFVMKMLTNSQLINKLTNEPTKRPTPTHTVLHEKLIVSQLVNKFPTFYGNQTILLCWQQPATFLLQAIIIQSSKPSHSISAILTSIITLLLQLCLQNVVQITFDKQVNYYPFIAWSKD